MGVILVGTLVSWTIGILLLRASSKVRKQNKGPYDSRKSTGSVEMLLGTMFLVGPVVFAIVLVALIGRDLSRPF